MASMGDNEVNETRSEPRISPVREIMLASIGAFVSIRGRDLLPGALALSLTPIFKYLRDALLPSQLRYFHCDEKTVPWGSVKMDSAWMKR